MTYTFTNPELALKYLEIPVFITCTVEGSACVWRIEEECEGSFQLKNLQGKISWVSFNEIMEFQADIQKRDTSPQPGANK